MRTVNYILIGCLATLIPACGVPTGAVLDSSPELSAASLDGEWIVVVDQVADVHCLTIQDDSVIVYDISCNGTDDALNFAPITFDEVGPTFILSFSNTAAAQFLLTETADGYNLTVEDLADGTILFTGEMRGF